MLQPNQYENTHGACTVSIPESSGCLAASSGQGGKISSRRKRSFRKMSSLGGKLETRRDKGALLLVIKLY